ncbi:MAG TPA: chromosome segregation protein SMC [Bacteroidetes bacterium]|nr:chromosome segregation protein SMC [Bacteroidota bacterium]
MIQSLYIRNFKSIKDHWLDLDNLNILIGPNGAGKSNFISLFKFLGKLSGGQLAEYIFQSGGINTFLFKGYEESQSLSINLDIKEIETRPQFYKFDITSDGESYQILEETIGYRPSENNQGISHRIGNGTKESKIHESELNQLIVATKKIFDNIFNIFKIYHFHDTSDNAPIKLPQDIEDVYHFKPEGENLAPFLLLLKEQHFDTYYKIVETTRLVYPFFHDFVLEESPRAKGKVMLRWKEKGNGLIYSAKQISDGTLRFICLATLLLQPAGSPYVPRTIILDEPELGLHPFAINILAELIQKAAMEKQVIVATQSVGLINHFTPKDLLITERAQNGATEFKRLKDGDFKKWLEDYSLGQLWESNFFGGRP